MMMDSDIQQVVKLDEDMLLSKPKEKLSSLEASESDLQAEVHDDLDDKNSVSSLTAQPIHTILSDQTPLTETKNFNVALPVIDLSLFSGLSEEIAVSGLLEMAASVTRATIIFRLI